MEVYELTITIFKGTVQGTVTERKVNTTMSDQKGAVISFIIKLDERITDIPGEIAVITVGFRHYKEIFTTHIQEGDKLIVNGEIKKVPLPFWQKEVYLMEAIHIFNETTNYGF